jgi:hypothetical protein
MAIIRVPKTPARAFNPRRRPGTLLQNQLVHLEWAVRPAGERTPDKFSVRPAKTEAEAASRIEALTLRLRDQTVKPPIVPEPKRSSRKRRRPAKAKRRTKQAARKKR